MACVSCFLHPHHATFLDDPHSLRSFFHPFEDPYYGKIGDRSHRGVVAPRFDVYATKTAYFLNGELPGVADKDQISVEWLGNQTLIIRGWIKPVDAEAEWKSGGNAAFFETASMSPKVVMTDKPAKRLAENGEQRTQGKGLAANAEQQTQGKEFSTDDHLSTEPRYFLHERHVGEFERSFTFPTNVKTDEMKAKLDNGLLKMMVPKSFGVLGDTRRVPIE